MDVFWKYQKYHEALLSVDYNRWRALVSNKEQDDVQGIMKSIVYEVIWGNELENTSKQQQQQ
jgi:hypothetical protein